MAKKISKCDQCGEKIKRQADGGITSVEVNLKNYLSAVLSFHNNSEEGKAYLCDHCAILGAWEALKALLP